MSGATTLAAQIAALQATVGDSIVPGLAADEAGVGVLAEAVAQVVGVLSALADRVTALEARETSRVAAELGMALHATTA